MIEPTESKSKAELDRFCDALVSIRREIQEVVEGKVDPRDNVLKNAPQTAAEVTSDSWSHPYTRTGRLPGAIRAREQVLAGRQPDRQPVW